MADIRELVPTFLESLSHNALCHNRKRETLDACIIPHILLYFILLLLLLFFFFGGGGLFVLFLLLRL